MHYLLAIITLCIASLIATTSCSENSLTLQQKIIKNAQLESINDAIYYFPANEKEGDDTVYLPLKRWDIIFTGAIKPSSENSEKTALDALIPGYYNHLMIYIGKDSDGYAYAFEINVKNIDLIESKLIVDGAAELIAISKDYGKAPHSSGGHVIDRNFYLVRWAKTFNDDVRDKLLEKDNALVKQLKQHLSEKFPYQLEFKTAPFPQILINKKVSLVDDGLNNGAGCGDYLSTVLEEIAGICLYNVRISAEELVDYYSLDQIGHEAYIPSRLNPLGTGSIYVHDLLNLGYYIEEDEPHIFSCNNTSESGVVIPSKIYDSDLLIDIDY